MRSKRKAYRENGSLLLFNCLVRIAAVSPLYFSEDQQKEARVLLKDVKEKLRKLRSMLGVPKMRARDFDRRKFILEEWPAALESGEFKQSKGALKSRNGGYCCLGVACELLSRKRLLARIAWEGETELPPKAVELLQISELGYFEKDNNLAYLNDSGTSFKMIAEEIRHAEKKKLWKKVDL